MKKQWYCNYYFLYDVWVLPEVQLIMTFVTSTRWAKKARTRHKYDYQPKDLKLCLFMLFMLINGVVV